MSLGEALGAQEPAHGVPGQPEGARNLARTQTLVVQRLNLGIPGLALGSALLLLALKPRRPCHHRWVGQSRVRAGGRRDGWSRKKIGRRGAHCSMATGEQPLERFAQIHQQVPTVRDLDRPGRALARAFGISASPIATEDLDARMILQPGGERCGGSLRQYINHLMAFLVDQDGAVGATALTGPVIHPQHAGYCRRGQRQRAHQPQKRHPADLPAKTSTQASAGPTAEGQPNALQGRAEDGAAASVALNKRGCLFGERRFWTGAAAAEEAADAEVHDDLPAAQRFVGDAPDIAAVDSTGTTPTGWAAGGDRRPPSFQMDDVVDDEQSLDPQPGKVREEDRELQ